MKKLYRSNHEKKVCGVCGGIAEVYDLDPSIVRLGFVVVSMICGTGILLYLAAALIIPKEGSAHD